MARHTDNDAAAIQVRRRGQAPSTQHGACNPLKCVLTGLAVAMAVASVVGVADAHFQLVSPTPGRGFAEGTETTPSCGGFNTVGTRISFSTTSSRVHLEILDGAGNVTLLWGAGSAPTSFVAIPGTTHAVDTGAGNPYAFDVPLNELNVTVNTLGTVQVVYTSDETFYQCQDVNVNNFSRAAPRAAPAWSLAAALALLLLVAVVTPAL